MATQQRDESVTTKEKTVPGPHVTGTLVQMNATEMTDSCGTIVVRGADQTASVASSPRSAVDTSLGITAKPGLSPQYDGSTLSDPANSASGSTSDTCSLDTSPGRREPTLHANGVTVEGNVVDAQALVADASSSSTASRGLKLKFKAVPAIAHAAASNATSGAQCAAALAKPLSLAERIAMAAAAAVGAGDDGDESGDGDDGATSNSDEANVECPTAHAAVHVVATSQTVNDQHLDSGGGIRPQTQGSSSPPPLIGSMVVPRRRGAGLSTTQSQAAQAAGAPAAAAVSPPRNHSAAATAGRVSPSLQDVRAAAKFLGLVRSPVSAADARARGAPGPGAVASRAADADGDSVSPNAAAAFDNTESADSRSSAVNVTDADDVDSDDDGSTGDDEHVTDETDDAAVAAAAWKRKSKQDLVMAQAKREKQEMTDTIRAAGLHVPKEGITPMFYLDVLSQLRKLAADIQRQEAAAAAAQSASSACGDDDAASSSASRDGDNESSSAAAATAGSKRKKMGDWRKALSRSSRYYQSQHMEDGDDCDDFDDGDSIDDEDDVPIPTLPQFRAPNKKRKDAMDAAQKKKNSGTKAGTMVAIAGSNAALSQHQLAHSAPHRLSEGWIVDCECCFNAYHDDWYHDKRQAKLRRIRAGLENGYLDVQDSDVRCMMAVGGLSREQITSAQYQAGIYAGLDDQRYTSASSKVDPLDSIGGCLPLAAHENIRKRFLYDLHHGRLVAAVDWRRRVVWVMACSEWENRSEEAKRIHALALKGEQAVKRVSKPGAAASAVGDDGSADRSDSDADIDSGGRAGRQSKRRKQVVDGALAESSTATGTGIDADDVVAAGPTQMKSRKPFRIVLVDVTSYIRIGDAQDLPPAADEPEVSSSDAAASSSAAATSPSSSNFPVAASSASSSSSTALAAAVALPAGLGATGGRVARASRARAAGNAAKEEKCPLQEKHAIELLLRLRYTAPHYIYETDEKGRCVFSGGLIPRNAFFCEYAGQLLTAEEGRLREAIYQKENQNGCYSYYFKHPYTQEQHCVDATAERKEYGIGRLLSHSLRHPNLACKVYMVDGVPRLVLHAKVDVQFGDEMQYDYGERSEVVMQAFSWLRE